MLVALNLNYICYYVKYSTKRLFMDTERVNIK